MQLIFLGPYQDGVKIPDALITHLDEVLAPDTAGESSPDAELARACAENRLGREHLPGLLKEARHLVSILQDGDADDDPVQAAELADLRRFVKRWMAKGF